MKKNETLPNGVRRHTRRRKTNFLARYRRSLALNPSNLLRTSRALLRAALATLDALETDQPVESAICGVLVATSQSHVEIALRRIRLLRRTVAREVKREAARRVK